MAIFSTQEVNGERHNMETGQRPKRGVQQNGERIVALRLLFIAKVINEFLCSFSMWTDFHK